LIGHLFTRSKPRTKFDAIDTSGEEPPASDEEEEDPEEEPPLSDNEEVVPPAGKAPQQIEPSSSVEIVAGPVKRKRAISGAPKAKKTV
jgi:hypothetical protein